MRHLAPAVVLALVMLGTGCGAGSGDSTVATPTTTTESSSGKRFREAAPNVAGTTLEGEAIALGDFRGRPVMINVWSSW